MRKLIVLLLLLLSGKAVAMSCIDPPIEERFRENKQVVLVQVVGARLVPPESYASAVPGLPDEIVVTDKRIEQKVQPQIVAEVHLLESYKGDNSLTELTLTTWGGSPSITVGATYLVFTNGRDVSLDCEGMMPIIESNPEHLRLLEKLRALAN